MVGQFKDDRVQTIIGNMYARDWLSNYARIYGDGSGAFVTDTTEGSWGIPRTEGNSGNTMAKGHVSFNSSRVTRGGDTTRGKSKGVMYIVKVL